MTAARGASPASPLTVERRLSRVGQEHRMLPGSHEQATGPECRCGGIWDRWNDECGNNVQMAAKPSEPAATGRYAVGDADPTPGGDCAAEEPAGDFVCTWTKAHDGDHVAGDGDSVCAVWPRTPRPAGCDHLDVPYRQLLARRDAALDLCDRLERQAMGSASDYDKGAARAAQTIALLLLSERALTTPPGDERADATDA